MKQMDMNIDSDFAEICVMREEYTQFGRYKER